MTTKRAHIGSLRKFKAKFNNDTRSELIQSVVRKARSLISNSITSCIGFDIDEYYEFKKLYKKLNPTSHEENEIRIDIQIDIRFYRDDVIIIDMGKV